MRSLASEAITELESGVDDLKRSSPSSKKRRVKELVSLRYSDSGTNVRG